MNTLKVRDIFGPTIQGEGSEAGTPVQFVRLAGCNRWSGREEDREHSICKFCDTDFLGGTMMTVDQIANKLGRSHLNIVFSGGEPLLQLTPLHLARFREMGYIDHVETNGSVEIPGKEWLNIHHVSMSPKQTRSMTKLSWATDIKVLWPPIGEEITPEAFNDFDCQNKFIQPVWDGNYEANLKSAVEKVQELSGWRLSLQQHKYLGVL